MLFENCNCQVVCPGHVHFSQKCTHERCVGYWALRFDEGRYGDTRLDGARAVVAFECPRMMIAGDWTEVVLIGEGASPAQRDAVEAILRGDAGGPWEVLARFVSDWLPTRVVPIEIEDEGKVKRVRAGLPTGTRSGSREEPRSAGDAPGSAGTRSGSRRDASGSAGTRSGSRRDAPGSAGKEPPPLLEGSVEDIRGSDRDLPVTIRNMFNQIHAPIQTIARGETRGDIGGSGDIDGSGGNGGGNPIRIRNQGTHGLHSRFEWRVGKERD